MKLFEAIPVLESRCDKLQRHCNNMLESFDAEEIHQFRLHTKKLRAFLHLLNVGQPTEGNQKISKPFQAFYKAVGELRNLQLHSEDVGGLCTQWQLPAPQVYLQGLREKEEQVKDEIRSLALRNPVGRFCRKLLKQAPTVLSLRTVEAYAAGAGRRLFPPLLTDNYNDECLHAIRKLLKQRLYLSFWIEATPKAQQANAWPDNGISLELTETLGDFMDCCTALQLLDAHNAGVPAGETKTLSALRRFKQDEKQRLKQKIVTTFQAWLQETYRLNTNAAHQNLNNYKT